MMDTQHGSSQLHPSNRGSHAYTAPPAQRGMTMRPSLPASEALRGFCGRVSGVCRQLLCSAVCTGPLSAGCRRTLLEQQGQLGLPSTHLEQEAAAHRDNCLGGACKDTGQGQGRFALSAEHARGAGRGRLDSSTPKGSPPNARAGRWNVTKVGAVASTAVPLDCRCTCSAERGLPSELS